jgi:hypothetical protein
MASTMNRWCFWAGNSGILDDTGALDGFGITRKAGPALEKRLAAIDLTPEDITYLTFSHKALPALPGLVE